MNRNRGVVGVLAILVAGIAGVLYEKRLISKSRTTEMEQEEKLRGFYELLIDWVRLYQNGQKLSHYLGENNIHTIAIYGFKELGECLYQELIGTDVKVLYIIDKDAGSIFADIDIVTPDQELRDVDAIIVTAIHYYNEISDMLSKKVDCQVLSLKDIIKMNLQ